MRKTEKYMPNEEYYRKTKWLFLGGFLWKSIIENEEPENSILYMNFKR
jgi:hypothetical protein